MTAFYDFFRKVKLFSPDGTLLNTIEADSVTDSIEFMAGEGVRWNNVNDSTVDGFIFDVKYDFDVPVGSTTLRLSDVNGNNKDIALVPGGNMTITRDNMGQLTIAALVGGVSKSISNITKTNPVRVTTTNDHNFTDGTPVTIVDVVGMTNVNGNEYFMDVIDGTNFDLYTDDQMTTTVNGTGFSNYTSGGVATADYGGAKQVFKVIRVAGQTDVVADNLADILTLTETNGLTISTTPATDTIDFAFSGGLDNLSDVKLSGTNFTNSIKIGDTTTGTLNAADGNVIIGVGAGNAISSGDNNVIIGTNAAPNMDYAGNSVIIGEDSVQDTRGFLASVSIGSESTLGKGVANTVVQYSVNIGYQAGNDAAQVSNINIGQQAGSYNDEPDTENNIAIGRYALKWSKAGGTARTSNIALGYKAGQGTSNFAEESNGIYIGYEAGVAIKDGSNNIFIGKTAGDVVESGSGNVIIGDYAGTTTLADTIAIYTGGGTERLTINSSGGSINTDTIATLTATQTLTNKTLTSPVINSPTGDVVTLTGSQTLTNKTLTTPVLDIPIYTNGFGGTGDMDIFGNANFKSTEAHAFADPRIYLSRQSPSPVANDVIGGLVLRGYDSNANADKEFASVYGKILDPTSTARDGRIEFHVATSNTVEHSASFENEYFNLMTGQKIRWHNNKSTTYECDLDWETPTAGRTITFPDANGKVAVSATAPVTLSAAGDIGLNTLPIANGGTGSTTAADARAALGLTTGTDIQVYDADLEAIAGLTSAADKGIIFTGSGTAGTFDFVANGRSWVALATASAQRDALDLNTTDDVQFDSLGVGTAASGTTGEIRATDNITGYYSSDSRLKENIVNIPDALDKVTMLKGVMFDWTDEHIKERGGEDGYFVKKRDTGLIAQDVQHILPEIVRKKKDGYLGIQYDKIVGLLVESIKELKAEVDELKSKKG